LFERWRQDGERGAAEEFDCVAIVDTLHLTAQPEDLLKKALDYLKPLGTLLVLSPNIATVIQRWKAKSTGDDKIRAGFEHSGVHAFSPRRVRSLIRSVNGMRPEKFSSDFDYAPGRTGQLRVLPGMRSQAASRFALSVVKGGSQTPQ
jgi:SAM-dependent methyltransferase